MLGVPQAITYHTAAWLLLDRYFPGWQALKSCPKCGKGELESKGPIIHVDQNVRELGNSQPYGIIRVSYQEHHCSNEKCPYFETVRVEPT